MRLPEVWNGLGPSPAPRPPASQQGFLRDGSLLHAVVASDERAQGPQPWSDSVDHLRSKRGSDTGVVVSAIAGDLPDGCTGADPGEGYFEAAEETHGVFLSICAPDWSSHVTALAEVSVSPTRRFALGSMPIESSLGVEVNASPITAWSWDADSNVVAVDDGVLSGGDTVDVAYEVSSGCDEDGAGG